MLMNLASVLGLRIILFCIIRYVMGRPDTGGKFTAGIVDTGGKFIAGVVDTGGKFTACVKDTGGHTFSEIYTDQGDTRANLLQLTPVCTLICKYLRGFSKKTWEKRLQG
jgi:hypothetical protein